MKKYFLIPVIAVGVIMLLTFYSCGNSKEKKQDDGAVPADTSKGVSAMVHDSIHSSEASLVYICPCGGCPEVRESKPGNCPKCGIELVKEKK